MRNLIYVPIIHTSADLGSIAKDVNKKGIANLGKDVWEKHIKTIDGFWDAILHYFYSIFEPDMKMKIYQDGMVADGEVGMKIVEQGIKSGSKNYELISMLIKKGGVLVKTEDFHLVKKELDNFISLTKAKSVLQKLMALIKYNLIKNILLNQRDKLIAKRIDDTLETDEIGIIFIGAFHKIKKKLPKDIQVIELKEISKVREYQKLLPFYHKYKDKFEELAQYLVKK